MILVQKCCDFYRVEFITEDFNIRLKYGNRSRVFCAENEEFQYRRKKYQKIFAAKIKLITRNITLQNLGFADLVYTLIFLALAIEFGICDKRFCW